MDLHKMQDLLNNLNAHFKIFTYPKEGSLVLRIFHEDANKVDKFTDVHYNMKGEYVIT